MPSPSLSTIYWLPPGPLGDDLLASGLTETFLHPAEHDLMPPCRKAVRLALRVLVKSEVAPGTPIAVRSSESARPAFHGEAVRFSVSHTSGAALIAVSRDYDVGVDLERAERPLQMPDERCRAIIQAGVRIGVLAHTSLEDDCLQGSASSNLVLQAWTGLEAFAKARGDGIGAVLAELGVGRSGSSSDAPGEDHGFQSHALVLPMGWIGAVALPQAESPPPITAAEPLLQAEIDAQEG